MGKIKIKTDDKVLVIAGEHKGSEGKVVKVMRDQNKAIVAVSYTHLTLPTTPYV